MKNTNPHFRTEGRTKHSFVHSRIKEDIKEQASLILDKLGLNVSDAIRLFLNQVVIHRGMPFLICIPNDDTITAMKAVDKGEGLEKVTLAQLQEQFETERKKLGKNKKSKK